MNTTLAVPHRDTPAADYSDWLTADEVALDYIATRTTPKFSVSVQVIARRLRAEKFWPPS